MIKTILYEDEHIIVVEKPVGMESQSSKGFLADMVSEIKKHIHMLSPTLGEPYVGVIHRLDKPVGGIMVYGKTQKATGNLCEQVAKRKIKKTYFAVLCGKPAKNVDNYVDYLLKDEKTNTSKIVDKGITSGKEARLQYQVLETKEVVPYGVLTLVEIQLLTGRHHQIRVQMAGHGFPLWGDQKYNPEFATLPLQPGAPRPRRKVSTDVALFSCSLAFTHPSSGESMSFRQLPTAWIFQEFSNYQLL